MHEVLNLPAGRTAFLLVDLQEEHRLDPHYLVAGYEQVLDNARQVLMAARRNDVPVFHAVFVRDFAVEPQRPFEPVSEDGAPCFSDGDTELTAICPEVAPLQEETVFTKQDSSCFGSPLLGRMLSEAEIEWLVICGVWTEACIAATVRDAQARGLRVMLVKDACGSGTEAMHQSAIVNLANRLYGGAVIDSEAACTLLAGHPAKSWRCEKPVPLRFELETLDQIYRGL